MASGGDVPSVFKPSSPEARAISELFGTTLVICAVIFFVVAGLVAYCIVRYKRREGDAEPTQVEGNTRLEVAWTAAPVVILIVLFGLTARTMGIVDHSDAHENDRQPDLVVIGHQWWWEVRYPASGVVTANEIHIPAGRKLLVRVESVDVIHDFWVPEIARKIDAVPGQPNYVWAEVMQPGVYLGACAEYCGAQHAWMRLRVVAHAQADFDAWQAREATPASPPDGDAINRGERVFRERTCVGCHAINESSASASAGSSSSSSSGASMNPRIGPDLTHLASRETLAAGATVNSPAELLRWLGNPETIKPESHMPNLHLDDAQLKDLAAYLGSLR